MPPTPMRPTLAALAAVQRGLVMRRQAVVAGDRERELRTLTQPHGHWVVVRRGVYLERELWEATDDVGRWRFRDHAAHLTMTAPHVLSHDSAARAQGLSVLEVPRPLSHVTRPGVLGTRTEHGVKHHIGRMSPVLLTVQDGVAMTGLARTALDLGREHGYWQGVVACDEARRRGVATAEFEAELALMRCWPDITPARAAVEFSDEGAESLGESLARILVAELGIGAPTTQFAVRVEGRTVWCDLRVGCHVFEFDGRVKYLRVEDGGLAIRDPGDVLWDEKARQTKVCGEGLGMSRIVWADFWGTARERAKARLHAEYAVTEARFGAVLPPHLAKFAARHPRRLAA